MFYSILIAIFHAFIVSHIRYDILIWGNTFCTYLHPINMLYKKAIRITLNQLYLEHMPPLAIKLHILPFDDLFKYHCSIFMYKTRYDLLPECISSKFIKLIDIHNRTRNC